MGLQKVKIFVNYEDHPQAVLVADIETDRIVTKDQVRRLWSEFQAEFPDVDSDFGAWLEQRDLCYETESADKIYVIGSDGEVNE